MSEDTKIGNNVDIDDSVTLGKGVMLRDNVNLRHAVVSDGVKIGRNTIIFGTEEHKVYIGKNCYISPNCLLNGAAGIELEEEVVIAAAVLMFSDSGPNVGPLKKYYPVQATPIKIGRGSWLGAGSVLLPGAEMEAESILAANSTLKSKVKFHEIFGGNPAKLIKKIYVQE